MADVIDRGSGPVLVFLHGAGVDNALWAPQISAFSETHRVIAPNLPGHGNVPAVASVAEMADHVHARLSDEGIRRYAVIGLSLGGMVALEIAGRWPQEVTHLVTIESVARVTDNPVARYIADKLVSVMGFVSPKLLSALPASLMGAETKDAAIYTKRALAKMNRSNNAAVLRAALAYDGRGHLPKLQIPTLIMVGAKNPSTHKRAQEISNAVRNADFVEVPHAGHIANRDCPEFVNDRLRSFLQQGS